MEKRALQLASVASMIDLFNRDNINILQSLGYQVDVATNFEEGSITSQERVNEFREELIEKGVCTYQIPIPRSIGKVRNILKSYFLVKNLVDNNNYQIVHCHSPIGGVICRLACRRARNIQTKVIYTAHGFHFYKGASIVSWLLYYPIELICSRYTDILITINQEDFQNAKKMFADRVEYVPGIGIHTKAFSQPYPNVSELRKSFGFSDNDFVFMSTGQLSKRKNHRIVIQALSLLNDPHAKYLIVGFGEEEGNLKKLVDELDLTNRVYFAGYKNNVKDILKAVDAFVFPSLQEGLPVALMEAMASGLPIVCSKIRGNVDLIEDGKGGYLFDCNDYVGFATGMKKIMYSNNNSVTQYNLKKICDFDISVVNENMQQIYNSCDAS